MSKCGRICKRLVASASVTVTDTALVVNLPDQTYSNCQKLCLLIAQDVPTTATRGLPVVITLGTNTTQYPIVRCGGVPLTQEYIANGNIYQLIVNTTSTSAIFKVVCDLHCANVNLQTIPVATGGA